MNYLSKNIKKIISLKIFFVLLNYFYLEYLDLRLKEFDLQIECCSEYQHCYFLQSQQNHNLETLIQEEVKESKKNYTVYPSIGLTSCTSGT